MNDRELLELAAKAAGYTRTQWVEDAQGAQRFHVFSERSMWLEWNPLSDDGDALRLAMKLNIHISLYGPETGLNAWIIRESAESFDEDYGDDPCASVRRAIVRAAAAIGAAMP